MPCESFVLARVVQIKMASVYIAILLFYATANAGMLPSNVRHCTKDDADYKKCILEAATEAMNTFRNGEKSLGLPKIDPLFVKRIHIAGNGGSVNLDQTFEDIHVYGLKDTKFTDISFQIDDSKCQIYMETLTPSVLLDGNYKVSGKLLVFTLNGHGKSKIEMTNLKIKHDVKCEIITKEDVKYIQVKRTKLDAAAEKMHFDIDNIIDGNPELSAEVVKVMNENYRDLYNEVKKDYEETLASILLHQANVVFAKVPKDEIFEVAQLD